MNVTAASLALVLVACLALFPTTAAAQANAAAAETLFREGVRLLEDGKTAEACGKFAESQRAEPALGTLINLATCHEKEGRTATAWLEFAQAASQAAQLRQRDREQLARAHVKTLEAGLHKIELAVAKPAPDLALSLDGQPVAQTVWATPFPVDPGEHRIEARAPGRQAWTKKFDVPRRAGSDRLDVPELLPDPLQDGEPRPAPAAVPAPSDHALETVPAPPPTTSASPVPPSPGKGGTRRTLGLVLGAAGVVTLGASGYFWLHTSSLDSDRQAADNARRRGTADSLRSDALSSQTVAVVTTAVGAAALGTGLVLFLTGGSSSREKEGVVVAPAVGATGSGMILRGSW